MEDQLVQVLANTQLAAEGPRKQAELDLKHVETNPAFPLSLANIGSHSSIALEVRQAALLNLRLFIERNWSGESDEGPVIPISDAVKEQMRPVVLDLALGSEDDRKIKTAASYVVGKIANVDFPDHWPTLLPTLLNVIATGTDGQLHGALKVLSDLVGDCLSDDQFFTMARSIVEVVYNVALNESRKPILRALAVSVFRGCFDLFDIVKDDHPEEVKGFAQEALAGWFEFFLQIMKVPLPPHDGSSNNQPESWNGIVALKLQVVKCLLKIRNVFSNMLLPRVSEFFDAAWEELSLLEGPHEHMYIENDAQGRLEDSDGLPYTLDFLVLEELDFLKECLKASPVQKKLEAQLDAYAAAHETPWVLNLMRVATSYARIPREDEDLWEIDSGLYLAEETSVSANYTPRTACGDLVIKLGEWQKQRALEGLFAYTKTLFIGEATSWRRQEAALFLLNMLVSDFLDCDKPVSEEIVQAYLELVNYTINAAEPLLRARGYLVGGLLVQCSKIAAGLFDRTVDAITSGDSDLVQLACIKAAEGFIRSNNVDRSSQAKVVGAVSQWIQGKDMTEVAESDDTLVTLAETLRAAINLDMSIAVSTEVPALDLLFLIAKHGATNWQTTMLICETFEDVVQTMRDASSYQALCAKVLPTLTGAFDVANVTEDNPLVTFATELMASLTQYGSTPLPPGFVAASLPKLTRLLMESGEGEVLRPGAESVKYLLSHDHQQVFSYHDENGRTGLEVCLHIIDRLLGPEIEDNAASEVGGLAAELVLAAGPERLGPFLPQLLQAVANRLATARAAPFIQSLILVFARLSLDSVQDVVEFLSTIQIEGQNGLQVVLSKWLENSVSFAGYDEIRQNVIALSKLYSLGDARVAQTMVKGDLIVPVSNRIMTRSRTKQTPDQYTIIPAPLKILKVLVEELMSASGIQSAAVAAAAAAAEFADEDDGEDGWEDDPDTVDLSFGGTKTDLMGFLESSNMRNRDDEAQTYLTEFFLKSARDNTADFKNWYEALTEEEKSKLNQLANEQA
ncbi:importin-beta domain-containing protein [Pseudomassariella vexata]|uniref:Importin-beta domain-containing protein n=1 Tax=Pseudomassariella vexata TaxID=1141098 RepID=A0A1Y2DGC7_9PEZI|nr:importin-beta domain-containing protein [Pseudomassariella vexata]ORY58176.1 importin-beta domain-containing protein [Pseudomassariella vexata]